MSTAALVCVPPEKIDALLPHISALLDRALKYGGNVTRDEALAQLRAGLFQLWLAYSERVEALAVTQLGADKSCTIVLCAGEDRQRWLHFMNEIERFAKAEGCTRMTIHARKGWMRVLSDYRVARVILEKEI